MPESAQENTINAIIAAIIKAEGGYSNNKKDRGGETMYGITAAVARANGYLGPMADLPRSLAEFIYRKRYYTEPNFHLVLALSERIAEELVDTGVNMGPHRAGEFLQRWLNGFNSADSGYDDLFVDGRIGPVSIEALSRFLRKRGVEGESVMLRALNCTQGNRYLEITENNLSQRTFLYGWVRARVAILDSTNS
ncbi:hypothetical protein NAV33_07325 [Pseudomonas stutzeri]|uniref:glycoside hydrolase family 108 protein n=1 Tax=Stutzerimonas stutzeri TaxID=316 RepID=UPI00210A7502|nr:glycosyl hydrolase 108 family protein [Stutzerimonas stutzeri]MCQ4311705.1 hypothetical protein [Stutzerimonas stutzeri]